MLGWRKGERNCGQKSGITITSAHRQFTTETRGLEKKAQHASCVGRLTKHFQKENGEALQPEGSQGVGSTSN